ncbi:tyrosine-type recombinase/integrase [Bacteroidales bacterium OttesenSCG-928-B11]|nr:tyrosine-type recombinase/integrase [Bacteroidales bacterium OttesenSCG-928-B11]
MSEALSLKNPKKRKIVFADDVQPYLPATLKQWKSGWTLVYYIENPETGIMERRRQRVDYIRNHFKSDKGAVHHVSKMIKGINKQLEKRYDPETGRKLHVDEKVEELTATIQSMSASIEEIKRSLTTVATVGLPTSSRLVLEMPEQVASPVSAPPASPEPRPVGIGHRPARAGALLKDLIAKYLDEIERNRLSEDTIRSYKSFVNIFTDWTISQFGQIPASSITAEMVADFMDYVYNERKGLKGGKMSNRTYNNYIKNGSAFFTWLVDKRYCAANLFDLKAKNPGKKRRILVPPEFRDKITSYLSSERPEFIVVLKLIYNSLIRPKEIRGIRVCDICFEKKFIRITGDVAKNDKQRNVPMTPDIYEDFKYMELHKYDGNCYVFGKELKTSPTKISNSYLVKIWARMRSALGLPEEMQMYSLRDSGMVEMIKSGIDQLSVKQLADHHSLSMTDIYTDHIDPNLGNIIYHNSPKFSSKVKREEAVSPLTPQPPL